jgi:hypothetical protein
LAKFWQWVGSLAVNNVFYVTPEKEVIWSEISGNRGPWYWTSHTVPTCSTMDPTLFMFQVQNHILYLLLDRCHHTFLCTAANHTKQNSLLPSMFYVLPNPLSPVVCPQ